MTRIAAGLSVLMLTAALGAVARAEVAPPPGTEEETRSRAREHAERARLLFDTGRFEEALAEYTAAYELAPAPGVLFNMGQCHRQLGDHERAIFFFRGYLRAAPDGPNRALAQQLVEVSERALAEERRRAEERRAAAEQRVADERRLRDEARAAAAVAPAAEQLGAAQGEAAGPRPFYRTWWFWTVVGAVVASGVTAGVVAGTWEQSPVLPGGSLGTIDGR